MLADQSTALVLLTFLAVAIERVVEIVMAAVPLTSYKTRRLIAVALSLALAAGLSFGLRLDIAGTLLADGSLSPVQGKTITTIALAGGSAPAHELLRLIEEARNKVANRH